MSQQTIDLIGWIETIAVGVVMVGGVIALAFTGSYDPDKRKNKKAS